MPASIFAGSKVKTLKDTLTLNGKSDIISSTVDPTASAVDAPIGSLLINQTSGKLYRKLDAGSSVNWEEVGAGVGGINYILNPSAEVNTTGWATYADAAGTAPVDGTGGSPNVTWTRSTTSPLRGVADFNFAKDAANRQGQGVSYDFTIDEADKAKVLAVTFDYEVLSGTYADGDLTVYLIADPTGTPVVIQPAGYTVQAATVGTTMREIATFQTQATGTSYRLCFHVASTSASAYTLAIDNVVVGPQQTVQGAAVSDWKTFTPTVAGISATPSGLWRRVGDSAEFQIALSTSGAASGDIKISVGGEFSFDYTKLSAAAFANIGSASANDGSGLHLGTCFTDNTSTNTFFISGDDGQNIWNATVPFTWAGTRTVSIQLKAPIQGWSSNTVMSQDTDTRVVAAKYTTAISQSINASSPVLVYETKEIDTHSAYNTSTGVYTVPVAGIYRVSAMLYGNAAATVVGYLTAPFLYKNGSFVSFLGGVRAETTAAAAKTAAGSTTVQCVAGDQLTIRGYSDTATSLQAGQPSQNHIEIERLSGPATIAASETVAMARAGSVVRSVPTAGAYLDFDFTTGFTDTHGAWRSGSGYVAGTGAWSVQPAYVVPVSGIYSVSVRILLGSTAGFKQLFIHRNGSTFASTADDNTYAGNFPLSMHGQIRCNAGDLLQVFFTPQNAQNAPSTISSFWTGIEISRVGN